MHEVAYELGSAGEADRRAFERHRFDFNPENLVERDFVGEDLAHHVKRLLLVTQGRDYIGNLGRGSVSNTRGGHHA